MDAKIHSMTSGSPWKMILVVALPLMLGNVFQQLYMVVDTAVVGQVLGVSALAALGTVDWLNWLFLGALQGMAQGFSIRIAQEFGAKNERGMKATTASIVILSVLCALVLTVAAEAFLIPIQHLMGTPQQVEVMARAYLRVMFAGLPITMAYNAAACLLRALGDSRTPLIAMIASSLFNIAADFLFVAGFHWGVTGAAAATVLSQLLAALLCIRAIVRLGILHPYKEDWKWNAAILADLMKLGIPVCLQNVIIGIGGVMVQAVVNGFGVAFIAGYTATNKLYGLLEIAAVSYGYAMTTYTGQNLGAGEYRRIRTGVRSAVLLGIATSAVISVCMLAFGKPILRMFISGQQEETELAMKTAYDFLSLMSCFLFILYVLHIVRSSLQGLGNTLVPLISGFVELVARLMSAFLLTRVIGEPGLYWCEVLAWLGADLILVPGYWLEVKKVKKRLSTAEAGNSQNGSLY